MVAVSEAEALAVVLGELPPVLSELEPEPEVEPVPVTSAKRGPPGNL